MDRLACQRQYSAPFKPYKKLAKFSLNAFKLSFTVWSAAKLSASVSTASPTSASSGCK